MCRDADVRRLHIEGTIERDPLETRERKTDKNKHFLKRIYNFKIPIHTLC